MHTSEVLRDVRKEGEVGMIQIAILFVLIALAISIVADIREGR